MLPNLGQVRVEFKIFFIVKFVKNFEINFLRELYEKQCKMYCWSSISTSLRNVV